MSFWRCAYVRLMGTPSIQAGPVWISTLESVVLDEGVWTTRLEKVESAGEKEIPVFLDEIKSLCLVIS